MEIESEAKGGEINKVVPIYEEMDYGSPSEIFEKFSDEKWNMLIDSMDGAKKGYGTNRYSYILIDPFDVYILQLNSEDGSVQDPLVYLREVAQKYLLKSIEALTPFQGGLAGYLSYDLAHIYHPVPFPKNNDLCFPETCIGFYDLLKNSFRSCCNLNFKYLSNKRIDFFQELGSEILPNLLSLPFQADAFFSTLNEIF